MPCSSSPRPEASYVNGAVLTVDGGWIGRLRPGNSDFVAGTLRVAC